MSFHNNVKSAVIPFYLLQDEENVCFECGEKISGSVVNYDGYTDQETIKSLLMHPGCANLVGQRLIADGFKNRRKK